MERKINVINNVIHLCIVVTMIPLSLFSQQISASDFSQRNTKNIPIYNSLEEEDNTNNLLVTINADYAKGNYPNDVCFSGNVEIKSENSCLNADKVQIYQQYSEDILEPVLIVHAIGNVCYENEQLFLQGKRGLANFYTKDIDIWEGNYQLLGCQGYGNAYLIRKYRGNRYLLLKKGSFTSCLPDSNIWTITGSKIVHDREKKIAKIWNARFKIGSIPIFYSPYLQVPIGSKRYSGFLTPSAKYTISHGVEFRLPYYWNISSNMDATITPCYIYKYGNIMWENEFRYLTRIGSGIIEIDYFPRKEKTYRHKEEKENRRHRWMLYCQHSLILDNILNINIDYTKASDAVYFSEFNSRYGSRVDTYAIQKLTTKYMGNNFESTVSIKQFQILNHFLKENNYRTTPQLDIHWKKNIGPFDFLFYAQKLSLIDPKLKTLKLTRMHFEPAIIFPLINNWGIFNTEAKLMITRYRNKRISWSSEICDLEEDLKNSCNRILPQIKIDGKFLIERKRNQEGEWIQILEPRIQYLYIPYRDQKTIQNYDSSFLQVDYDGLFRDRLYGGIDRISSTNQLKTGVQAYIYDQSLIERFKVSIGQSYGFTFPRTGDNFVHEKNKESGFLFWVGDLYWKMTDRWRLQNTIQYSRHLDNLVMCSSMFEYLCDEERTIRLTYRYANPKYIQTIFQENFSNKQYRNGISRVEGSVSWPISNHWSVIGTCYLDAKTKRPEDHMIALQHSSCCCVVRLGYENKISYWNIRKNLFKYDKVIGLNVELRGLTLKS